MKIIGLTGGIACGKSVVSNYLQKRGIAIIDADKIAHALAAPHQPIWELYVQHFGTKILQEDGSLNRRLLGQLIFANPQELAWTNQSLHPIIRSAIISKIDHYRRQGSKLVIVDIPLLFEAHWQEDMDEVWVVFANHDMQLARIVERDGLSLTEASERIASQMPVREKVKLADCIIDNSHTLEDTYRQVEALLNRL